jgi:hypothetical protein
MATDLLNLFSEQNVAAGIYDDGFYRVADDLRRGGWFWIALSNAGDGLDDPRAMPHCTTFMRSWR